MGFWMGLDWRMIDGFDEQLRSNYQFNATIQFPFGKPTASQNIKVEINSEQKNGMALNWHHHKIKHICYVVRAYLTTKPKLSINLISSKCKNVGDHINMK